MMFYIYVDGAPVPLTAYLQVVAESLLDVAHSLSCPCQKLPRRYNPCVPRSSRSPSRHPLTAVGHDRLIHHRSQTRHTENQDRA